MKAFLLKFFCRASLYFMKVDVHFLSLRFRNALLFKNTRGIKPRARFLNIGCGLLGVESQDWFNIDGWPAPTVDFTCDLRRRLPFSDGRFDGIFSEHFLEHLYHDEAMLFLRESFRLLRSGGILRLSVPDGELFLRNYFADRDWILRQIEDRKEWMGVPGRTQRTPMELINAVFRQHFEHQFCYDFETISMYMSEAGFAPITRVGFESGGRKELQIDAKSRRVESLYVEATKP